MRKLSLLLIIFLSISCQIKKHNVLVSKVDIYQGFIPAGTTNYIRRAFIEPAAFRVIDTARQNALSDNLDLLRFTNILNNAKAYRHMQTKIGGIKLAGKFYSDGKYHFFTISSPKLVIDFTDKINYSIINPDDQLFLQNIIDRADKKNP